LNGAVFYYDYVDKQLRGRIQTFFGQLEKLVNIPKSEIRGGELELLWYPIESFTLTTTASYIHSEIKNNPDGSPYLAFPQRTHGSVPVSGEAFPYTPEWTLAVDGEYRWHIASSLEAFVGAAATYQSRTKSGLESADPGDPLDVGESATDSYNDPLLSIPGYLLLDLRAGIERSNGRWSLSVWGKNVTNEYYRVNVLKTQDTMLRYPGEPATYGVTLGVNL
jgi:iron complex outermembrane receptor protein